MTRQRVSLRLSPLALLSRLLTIVFAVVLIYGGVICALLALKTNPSTLDRISGYRTGYHWLAALHHSQFTTGVSLIAGFGGLILFLVFAFLVLHALPRPHFTRSEVPLPDVSGGTTIVRPRAVERVAEVAASTHPRVIGVTGRLGDDAVNVDVGIDTASEAVATLADVRRRVIEQLRDHQLPAMPVNVTLTGYEPPTRREPS